MVKPPFPTLPQLRAFSSHCVMQIFQNFQVKCLVNSSTVRNKFWVDNTVCIKKRNQHRLHFGLHSPCFFGMWWSWTLPLAWLLLCLRVIGVAPAFITSTDLRKKIRVDIQVFFQFTTRIHSGLPLISHEHMTHKFCCNSFSFAIPRSKSVGRNSRTHQTNQQVRQLFCDGLPRSVHKFSRCFHLFGRSRVALSEVGLQVTVHHLWSGKTTRKLVFSPEQLSCKLFQALQLLPLPFSLTENRISQPHVVPTFQPSQKSTNKWEALNKKIYHVILPLHSTTLVSRLMQKGPHKRHLAAEAFTTMGLPSRERFWFLLGPPLYTGRAKHGYLWTCVVHQAISEVFTYLITYSMEQSPSWKANWFSATQQIHCILWHPKGHYRIHKYLPPVHILSQLDPVHTHTSHFL